MIKAHEKRIFSKRINGLKLACGLILIATNWEHCHCTDTVERHDEAKDTTIHHTTRKSLDENKDVTEISSLHTQEETTQENPESNNQDDTVTQPTVEIVHHETKAEQMEAERWQKLQPKEISNLLAEQALSHDAERLHKRLKDLLKDTEADAKRASDALQMLRDPESHSGTSEMNGKLLNHTSDASSDTQHPLSTHHQQIRNSSVTHVSKSSSGEVETESFADFAKVPSDTKDKNAEATTTDSQSAIGNETQNSMNRAHLIANIADNRFDDENMIAFIKGRVGEDCDAACDRVSGGKLTCKDRGFEQSNDCDRLVAAFGCQHQCLAGYGPDKPGVVKFTEHDDPICFVNAEMTSVTAAADCAASSAQVLRLCPCGVHNKFEDSNKLLRRIIEREAQDREADHTRIQSLSEAVEHLLQRLIGTRTQLAATTKNLEALQQEEAQMGFFNDLLNAARKGNVDYESGEITLSDGSKMSYAEATSKLEALLARQRLRTSNTVEGSTDSSKSTSSSVASFNSKDTDGGLNEKHTQVGEHDNDIPDESQQETSTGSDSSTATQSESNTNPSHAYDHETEDTSHSSTQISDLLTDISSRTSSGEGGVSQSLFSDPAIFSYDTNLLQEIGTILCAAAFAGSAAVLLGLPPSLGYLAAGMVIGPSGFGVVTRISAVSTLAQFGVVFPLFISGIQFGEKIADQGRFLRSAIYASLGHVCLQTIAVASLGYVTGLMSTPGESMLIGLASCLSSPGSSVVALGEANQLATDAGKLSLGILATQDLLMGLLLSLPHITTHSAQKSQEQLVTFSLAIRSLARSIFTLALMIAIAVPISRWLVPRITLHLRRITASQEVKLLGLVAVCMTMALITEAMEMSLEMGAFFAGLLLSAHTSGTLQTSILAVKQHNPTDQSFREVGNTQTIVQSESETSRGTHLVHRSHALYNSSPQHTDKQSEELTENSDKSSSVPMKSAGFSALVPVSSTSVHSNGIVEAIRPLNDVFGSMFFTSIGLVLNPGFVVRNAFMIISVLFSVCALKGIILFSMIRVRGFKRKTAQTTALALSQVAEYALAFIGKSHAMGLVSRRTYLYFLTATVCSVVLSPLFLKLGTIQQASRTSNVHENNSETNDTETYRTRAHSSAGGSVELNMNNWQPSRMSKETNGIGHDHV